jgi:hypothetical protein
VLKLRLLSLVAFLATLASIRLAQGRTAAALHAARDAMAKYGSMGACGFFRGAFARLVHSECLHAEGHREAARGAIAKARQCILANANKSATRNTAIASSKTSPKTGEPSSLRESGFPDALPQSPNAHD